MEAEIFEKRKAKSSLNKIQSFKSSSLLNKDSKLGQNAMDNKGDPLVIVERFESEENSIENDYRANKYNGEWSQCEMPE